MAASWERNLRRLIKDTHGQGWSLRQKGLGTTQVTRRWSDNSRSSATVRIPWKRSIGPKLLALIERLAIAIAPEAEGGQGLTLARAAELIQLEDEGVSVQTIRSGSVDWLAVADRYRHHQVEVTGAVAATTWHRHHRRFCAEVLEILGRKRAPKDAATLLAQLIEEHPTAPGATGRRERLASASGLLLFAVQRCGAPERWRPPTDLRELTGKRADRKEDGTPLLDDQALRIYRAIASPQWRLAWGLMICFGIRPVEIGCCRADGDALLVEGVKRNSAGRAKDRRVLPLDPDGFPGMGATLLSLLAERGRAALPHEVKAAYWSTRAQKHLRTWVPEWEELVSDASAAGQGHLTVYSCRHGYAFRGTGMGLDHRTLSKLMGHDPQTHLKHYGRWSDDESVAAAVAAAVAVRNTASLSSRVITQ